MINPNRSLEPRYSSLSSSSYALQLSGYVGRTVMIVKNTIKLEFNRASVIYVQIPADVYQIKLVLSSTTSELIRTILLGKRSLSLFEFLWDGMNDNGEIMNPDTYYLHASCLHNGTQITLLTLIEANVNGVNINQNTSQVYLTLSDIGPVNLTDIMYLI